MFDQPLLNSFFIAGFEYSTHRRANSQRLDLPAASEHVRFTYQDFCRLKRLGTKALRSGLRWPVAEKQAATEAVWEVVPEARIVYSDPAIHIAPQSDTLADVGVAEGHRQAQFQAWDMLCGRRYVRCEAFAL